MKQLLITSLALLLSIHSAKAQQPTPTKSMELFGFVMTDIGYNFNQIDAAWFDIVRPTKLPSFKNEFGTDGNTYFSVRQTRLGLKNYFTTPMGEMHTWFEFEMFGTGADAGQTTFRLRHAYGELGQFGFGQTVSPFMDMDVFPNSIEYWGPNGMVLFRNIQVRWMPIKGADKLTFAIERPGASADQGIYAGASALGGIRGQFPMPDISGEYRKSFKHGYVELGGMFRRIQWKDQLVDSFNLNGGAWGWGLNVSTNLKLGKKLVFKGQFVTGAGIQNYMNDATVDIGIQNNLSNPQTPIKGIALPMYGAVAFLDINWSKKFSSTVGYSILDIENADADLPNAFSKGEYALANLLYYPTENAMVGIELQYGTRNNFSDGFSSSITKLQCSFKYNFSQSFYNTK